MTTTFRFRPGAAVTDVVVGEGASSALATRLPKIAPGRWFLVSSAPVFALHGEAVRRRARTSVLDPEPVLVPDGEAAKTWASLGKLLSDLVARGLKRDGGVVALGGGTVGDVAALAASLVLRGVPVVQLPTTLLAASDSAIGGKTAVDLPAGKNLAGTFHHPRLVAVDTELLATLPERAYRSGLAEVVKASMLDARFDAAMVELAPGLARREPASIVEAVTRALKLKARVVALDPDETKGRRAILNLGHTVGHALESASGFRLPHGEAVAWGLLAILEASVAKTSLAREDADRLARRTVRLVAARPLARATLGEWPARLGADKKSDSRGLKGVFLAAPGKPVVLPTDAAELANGLEAALRRIPHD